MTGLNIGSKTSEDFFLTSTTPLYPGDAVAALIVLEDDRYLLQLRDQKAGIFFPGHWGLFGGAVDEDEKPLAALCRELEEELNLKINNASMFTQFDFDLTPLGFRKYYRIYYEVPLSYQEYETLVLKEGEKMKAFTDRELLNLSRVAPYDAFALWFHIEKNRLR